MSIGNLMVMADEAAVSFCHYPEPTGPARTINTDMLNQALARSGDEGWAVTVLLGHRALTDTVRNSLDAVPHARIGPIGHPDLRSGDLAVAGPEEFASVRLPDDPSAANLVLRLPRHEIGLLSGLIRRLTGRFRRLGLVLLDIPSFTESDIENYSVQLADVSEWLLDRYAAGDPVELSFLTDRLLLAGMNNCDPGTRHLTMAPDGRLYLCPGFRRDEPDDSVGTIREPLEIPAERLLRLENAPICRICDAWHCKRCLWYNRKTTLEINTPSRQQCLVAHRERNQSRLLLDRLSGRIEFSKIPGIPELDYSDPLEELERRIKYRKPVDAPPPPSSGTGRKSGVLQKQDSGGPRKVKPLTTLVPEAWNAAVLEPGALMTVLTQILETQRRILSVLEKQSMETHGDRQRSTAVMEDSE